MDPAVTPVGRDEAPLPVKAFAFCAGGRGGSCGSLEVSGLGLSLGPVGLSEAPKTRGLEFQRPKDPTTSVLVAPGGFVCFDGRFFPCAVACIADPNVDGLAVTWTRLRDE